MRRESLGTETHTTPWIVSMGRTLLANIERVPNGYLIRCGLVPCETNPDTGGLSRTGDPAHALAVFTITGKGFESRHVCRGCVLAFYANRPIKEGVIWS